MPEEPTDAHLIRRLCINASQHISQHWDPLSPPIEKSKSGSWCCRMKSGHGPEDRQPENPTRKQGRQLSHITQIPCCPSGILRETWHKDMQVSWRVDLTSGLIISKEADELSQRSVASNMVPPGKMASELGQETTTPVKISCPPTGAWSCPQVLPV